LHEFLVVIFFKVETSIKQHIFRAYDIRGIADSRFTDLEIDLDECTAYMTGRATAIFLLNRLNGKFLQNSKKPIFAVGRDGRLTGEILQKAFMKGLLEEGIDVIDLGVLTSPMLYFAVCNYKFDGGAVVTASHNPREYNGIKIVEKAAHSICGEDLQEIYRIALDLQQIAKKSTQEIGFLQEKNVLDDYVNFLTNGIALKKKWKVAIDSGNGVSGIVMPKILKKIGCEVLEIYCEVDGNFPNHEANPEEEENMMDLIGLVNKERADLGFGFDGDGDRVGMIDENGKHYHADFLLMLLARDVLARKAGAKIVFDVKVSQLVINDIEKIGGVPVMSRTGHSFIENKMKEEEAVLGGEVSGHLFFAENYFGFDDAALAAVRLLKFFDENGVKVSAHFADLPKMFTTPEYKLPCPDDKKFAVVESLQKTFSAKYPAALIDGVRFNVDEFSWAAVRASNTSPNLTLRFESNQKEILERMKKEMAEAINSHNLSCEVFGF
jgi:phosphomannomutase/phosphoglucomutase